MSCEVYRELLPAYLDDSLDEVRRTGFRAHLRACDDCRRAAVSAEPTLAFSLVRPQEPAQDRIETCVTSVIAGIRRERLEKRLQPSRRPWFAAAAVVVLAIIAATVWWLNTGQPGGMTPLQANSLEVETVKPVADEGTAVSSEPPPRVEVDMGHEEVRVYQYAIGDDATTGAVFIVNPAMEL
jgi:predicted anti-sigma-YlaC factor YlaD